MKKVFFIFLFAMSAFLAAAQTTISGAGAAVTIKCYDCDKLPNSACDECSSLSQYKFFSGLTVKKGTKLVLVPKPYTVFVHGNMITVTALNGATASFTTAEAGYSTMPPLLNKVKDCGCISGGGSEPVFIEAGSDISISGDGSEGDPYIITNTSGAALNLTGEGIVNILGSNPDITITATEADGDPTNEIQDLDLTGDLLTLSLSDVTIDLSPYLSNWFNTDLEQTDHRTHDGNNFDFTAAGWRDAFFAANANFAINAGDGGTGNFTVNAFGGGVILAGDSCRISIAGAESQPLGAVMQKQSAVYGNIAFTPYSLPTAPSVGDNGKVLVYNNGANAMQLTTGDITPYTVTAPITLTGHDIGHATSGVTAASYGSATQVPVFTVNATGHVTGVTNTAITFPTPPLQVVDEITATGSQTAFTLTNTLYTGTAAALYRNGVLLTTACYSVSGTTLTYVPASNGGQAMVNGDRVNVVYQK